MHTALLVELTIILLTIISLFSMPFSWMPSHFPLAMLGLAALLLVIHFAVIPFRWQLIPAALVVGVIVLGFFFGWESGRFVSSLGYVLGTLALLLSAALSLGLPIRALPEPTGPHGVGVTSTTLAYVPQTESRTDMESERTLFLKFWYPSERAFLERHRRDTVWSEFSDPSYFSPLERVFAGYLKAMKTSSYIDAPLAEKEANPKIIVYNHALLSIASENTLLMEALASHGYIVISVQHGEQRKEYASIQKNLSPDELEKATENLKRLGTANELSRAERSALSLQVFRENTALSEIVRRRAADSKFVLDHLDQILSSVPNGNERTRSEQSQAAFIGLSLGGAVGTELCKTDKRCVAVVNLDGGLFGTDIEAPVKVPYLMLYSERNEGGNDFLRNVSSSNFEDHSIEGADHLNFHDATFLLPGLKWLGLLGKIDGSEMIDERNRRVLDFLSRVH